MSEFRQIGVSLHKHWQALPSVDRWRVWIVVLTLPVAVFLGWQARQQPIRLVALMTNLQKSEVVDCTTYLKGRRIPFEVRDDGHDLWVPAHLRAELKVELARFVSRQTEAGITLHTSPMAVE